MTQWRAILRLAKSHSGTVGFLPDAAFADRVRKGTFIAALLDSEIVGYILYDLPRVGHIKLVHVCVDESTRGLGVGKRMIDEAIRRNPNAIGVLAYCRRDYEGLDHFWSSAGLSPRSERQGRAVQGSILSAWWRPLGGLDLIEEAALASGLPLVVYDTNVVSDLYASDTVDRPDREASLGLLAGWVQAAITPAVSPRVDVELNRIESQSEREYQRRRSHELLRLRSDLSDDRSVLDALLINAGEEELRLDPSLRDDLQHLADAITVGAAYLVSNDDNFLRMGNQVLPASSELAVVRPHELVAEMLNLVDRPVFQSRLIESVDLEWRPASDFPIDDLSRRFVSHERREKSGDFNRRIRAAISRDPRAVRVLVDPSNRLWALLSQYPSAGELSVDFLRVDRSPAASTVALQLARHMRTVARDSSIPVVRVLDPFVSTVSVEALAHDGYVGDDAFKATLIDDRMTISTFAAHPLGWETDSPASVRSAERKYWPLALIGADVPTFIAPIQPRFAEQLFGVDRGALWIDRKRGLGLSREHVYYSGSARSVPTRDSRVLWYLSKDRTGTVRSIAALSRVLSSERLPPEEAHAANSQIGVFTLQDVRRGASKDGLVTVLRFEDTEILDIPVGGSVLNEMLLAKSVKHPIMSFRKVAPEVFDAVVALQGRKLS